MKVIYDAAHAFAVKYKGKSSASFGDISMFRFMLRKFLIQLKVGVHVLKKTLG